MVRRRRDRVGAEHDSSSRSVLVVGISVAAPPAAAFPDHAGIRISGGQADASAATEFPPGPGADVIAPEI